MARPTDPNADPARVLGVPAGASADQVRRAYKRLARRYHPDRNPDPAAAARFSAIKQAHDALLARIAARDRPPPPPARRPSSRVPADVPFEFEPPPPTLGEIARPALYVVGALVWFAAMCGFFSFLQEWGRYRPPDPEIAAPPPEEPPFPPPEDAVPTVPSPR